MIESKSLNLFEEIPWISGSEISKADCAFVKKQKNNKTNFKEE
jgi:hypothetical protein|tara:strand:+ start:1113 stop:1241 length:129 start_codon:yes stop_codon:yes gene_type:complete